MVNRKVGKRLKYFIAFRLFFTIALLGVTILSRIGLTTQITIKEAIFIPIYTILIILISSNIPSLILFKIKTARRYLPHTLLYFDIIFVSLLTLASGINAIYSLFYFIPIVFAPLILDRRNSIFVTSVTVIAISTAYLIHILISTGTVNWNILGLKQGDLNIGRLGAAYISTITALIIVSILSNILSKELAAERYLRSLLFDTVVDAVVLLDKENNVILKNHKFDEFKIDKSLLNKALNEVDKSGELQIEEKIFKFQRFNLEKAGQSGATALVFRDITAEKELEKNRQEQEYYKYVLHISSTLAHEIRNPLTSIKGASQEMKKILDDKQSSSLLNLIIKESDKLNVILSDFLNYSSQRPLNIRIANFEEILDNAINMARLRYKDISIEKKTEAKSTFAKIDPDKIGEALLNLILNAAQSKNKGVKITIRLYENSRYLVTTIQDNGEGIPQEIKNNIFTPFITTKKQGTGLGLAITKRIIDNHQGKIEFESVVGKGTMFKLFLPK